jgi:3-dehydroquinate dehydratase-2
VSKFKVLLVSGPNLSILGMRQPEIYGYESLKSYEQEAIAEGLKCDIDVRTYQSDSEAEIVQVISEGNGTYDAIVINAGALTHYSWSISDALANFGGKVIELHITNPNARATFRHKSVIAPVSNGLIAGFGIIGYKLAILAVHELLTS